jgi:hypothetical protein
MADKNLPKLLAVAKEFFNRVLLPRCQVVMSEVAISVNWTAGTAEILPSVKDRQYPERDGWQNGTADLVCILKDETLLIADWKTGGSDGATEQLLSLAIAFQKCLKLPNGEERQVRVACLSVTEEGVDPDERAVSSEQLSNHWTAMEMAWADRTKKNEPNPGIHCTQLYCPHLAYCSAVTGLVEDAAGEDDIVQEKMGNAPLLPEKALVRKHRMTDKPRSNEEAGYVMSRVAAARRQQKYYESCMKEYIANGGRVTAGNYEWRETGAGYRWGRMR